MKTWTTRNVAAFIALLWAMLATDAASAQTIKVYGPGGPAPTVKEVALLFKREKNIDVEVVAGPTSNWLAQAKQDAHVVFSGSENMMLSFLAAFDGQIETSTIAPIYLRPSTILVRKGNPKGIKGLRDLAKPGMRVIVTEGAGQLGMWEDVAGRTGDLALLRAFRTNIAEVANNSGAALKSWREKPDLDGWLIWNHWQIANPDVADQVPVESELTIWRPMSVALTKRGIEMPTAQMLVDFLTSPPALVIFKRWGWSR